MATSGAKVREQVEALKRFRSKGEQKVIVEHLTVIDGQAIVGNVATGGGGANECRPASNSVRVRFTCRSLERRSLQSQMGRLSVQRNSPG